MLLLLRRVLGVVVLLGGLALCALVFLVGAPAVAGAPLREPAGGACLDPWVESHPGDFEPDIHGEWTWWPPGLTCTHASGEVYVEPTASDAAEVGVFGLVVLVLGVAPTVLVAGGVAGVRPAARSRAS